MLAVIVFEPQLSHRKRHQVAGLFEDILETTQSKITSKIITTLQIRSK